MVRMLVSKTKDGSSILSIPALTSIHYRKYKLVDKYIICIDNVEPSNSIKTTIHEQDLLSHLTNIIMWLIYQFYRYNNEDLV